MKKIVPDPPSLDITNSSTASTPFGTNCMFTVRAGIPSHLLSYRLARYWESGIHSRARQ